MSKPKRRVLIAMAQLLVRTGNQLACTHIRNNFKVVLEIINHKNEKQI